MSGQLKQSTPLQLDHRRQLIAAWQSLQAELLAHRFTSVEQCCSQLQTCWPVDPPPDGGTLRYLAERMSELAGDIDQPTTMWRLFCDAVGFPLGEWQRLAQLSTPPRIIFGPNPWVAGTSDESLPRGHDAHTSHSPEFPAVAPLSADVSEGKGHVIYNAHSYHTKVPHRAIMRYILHYTQPGDVVLDGFCGTGMTGVAAALCGDRREVEALGYHIHADGRLTCAGDRKTESSAPATTAATAPETRLGIRHAVLLDLSPAATLIASVYNSPHDAQQFRSKAHSILDRLEEQLGWMYWTVHSQPTETSNDPASRQDQLRSYTRRLLQCEDIPSLAQMIRDMRSEGVPFGTIGMIGWSEVFECPHCRREFVFADAAVDSESGKVADRFACLHCGALLRKRELTAVRCSHETLCETPHTHRTTPVWVHYQYRGKRYRKRADAWDRALIEQLGRFRVDRWYPQDRLFLGRETRRNDRRGITHIHHFYTPRNLRCLAAMREACDSEPPLLLWFTSQLVNVSKLNRYRPAVTFPYNPLSGTLYVGSLVAESNPLIAYRNKSEKIAKALETIQADNRVICGSLSGLLLPDESVDYIFTDPPFGGNLAYSELNLLWESWLGVLTHRSEEAIETRVQGKSPEDYAHLMKWCFRQYFRVLKPGKWITVEFHHTQPHVWDALQQALCSAGFVIADVRTLDKKLGTFKQVTNPGTVKQDLIVSAFKPRLAIAVGHAEPASEAEIWDFVDSRLMQLPLDPAQDPRQFDERQDYRLFNRLVAWLLETGRRVPLSAPQFYAELRNRYTEKNERFFVKQE